MNQARLLSILLLPGIAAAQTRMDTQNLTSLDTAGMSVKLAQDSGVAVNLRVDAMGGFDFLPADRLVERGGEGFVHLGDFSLRITPRPNGEGGRGEGATAWKRLDTQRPRLGFKLVSQSKTNRIEEASFEGLTLRRTWQTLPDRVRLTLDIKNGNATPLEIGALGFAMPFNNIITHRSLEEAHAKCSLTDPYIGGDAGYLQVNRLDGTGNTLLVTPVGKTPLESWRLINEPMRPSQVFEGMMEWTVHSKAIAETEWQGVDPWVNPTSAILKPGQSTSYGVDFSLAPEIRQIESTLAKLGRPVAVGIPGTIIPQGVTNKLFLQYGKPVSKMKIEPAGALKLVPNRDAKNGWRGYDVHGLKWGRARLTLTYADGTEQVVSYKVTKPADQVVADLGKFLTTKAWYDNPNDPFGRSPSPMSYDREIDGPVLQDSRAWIAGLGDEGGGGNWLAFAMKQFGQPVPDEVAKLEAFVNQVIWGGLQYSEGPRKYGVKKSLFFYDSKVKPDFKYDTKFNWTSWTSWNKEHADEIGRGYNYPHVVAAYWSLYRIARHNPEMVKVRDWQWYLEQAYQTVMYLTSRTPQGWDTVGYWRLGLMGGTVFLELLNDLKKEGWTEKATQVEARMKERADRWKDEAFPFGSEMPWDSTGQEEVHAWCRYFGHDEKAIVTLNAVLAYMPTVPHWGYNGNARRYWDFLYGGKLSRIERQIHHYGSGLNALPVLKEYRRNPQDLYLLRVGYGGVMGPLSNIDQEGFASAAFHSFPQTLKWDPYSGDYGPNLLGHSLETATYLVETKDWGWQAFGGEVSREGDWVIVKPRDSYRRRVFIAPGGKMVEVPRGRIEEVRINVRTKVISQPVLH